jgi:hypothetical protein
MMKENTPISRRCPPGATLVERGRGSAGTPSRVRRCSEGQSEQNAPGDHRRHLEPRRRRTLLRLTTSGSCAV